MIYYLLTGEKSYAIVDEGLSNGLVNPIHQEVPVAGREPPPRKAEPRSSHGEVFTPDLIETVIAYKQVRENEGVALRPHPCEFALYCHV